MTAWMKPSIYTYHIQKAATSIHSPSLTMEEPSDSLEVNDREGKVTSMRTGTISILQKACHADEENTGDEEKLVLEDRGGGHIMFSSFFSHDPAVGIF